MRRALGQDQLHLTSTRGADAIELDTVAPMLSVFRGHAGLIGYARRPGAKVTVTVSAAAG